VAAAPLRGADVIVVGGGVVGCSVAWHLAREGLDVVLLERSVLAGQASGAAAGMLAPVGEGAVGSALLRYGLESLARFPSLCEELRELSGVDPEFEPSGILRLAQTGAEERALRAKGAALRSLGLDLEWLDEREADSAQPGLAEDLRGALWSPREANLRSPLLVSAYAGAARALGARIVTAAPVVGLQLEGDQVVGVRSAEGSCEAGCVVVATGAWCGDLAEWLPARFGSPVLPIEPVRGQIVSLDAPLPPLRTIVWGEGAYLVPKRDGSVVVGATEERVGFDCRVTAEGVGGLLAAATRLVPALREAGFRRSWAGLRPGSPDGLPAIGWLPGVNGLLVAAGHHRTGVLLSPTTGAVVRDLVLGKDAGAAAIAFDPARWGRR
jgi:glycine oxidase